MIYEYKLACIEAGLSEKQIREIEQVFDTDYKRLKYEQRKLENLHMEFVHFGALYGPDSELGTFEIADPSIDLEGDMIHRCDLEHLREVLQELPAEDCEFLMDAFSGEGYIKRLSQKYKMKETAVIWRRKKLVKELREKFFEKV